MTSSRNDGINYNIKSSSLILKLTTLFLHLFRTLLVSYYKIGFAECTSLEITTMLSSD